jgi:hypothetical protein
MDGHESISRDFPLPQYFNTTRKDETRW